MKHWLRTILAFALVLGLMACSSGPALAPEVAPEQLLPAEAMIYVSLDRQSLDQILPAMLADHDGQRPISLDERRAAVAPLSERSERLVAAIVPASRPGETARLYAVARGRYPVSSLNLALGLDRGWQRHAGGWLHRDSGLSLHSLGSGTLLISSDSQDTMLRAAAAPGPRPIPDHWQEAWSSSLAVYIRSPLQALAGQLPVSDLEIPLSSLMLSGREADGRYQMFVSFEFDSPRSAQIFSPISRLVFYALVHRAWPQWAASILDDSIWRTEGRVVSNHGWQLPAEELAGLATLIQ